MSALFKTARDALVISSEKSDVQFRVLTDMIAETVAESSRRVYANTYRQWSAIAERGRRRSQRALNRTEVAQLLDVWAADQRLVGIRNHALLRLMIFTGLRRAEIVTLRWDDIDFEDQLVTVRHGKGDKRRVAAIADVTNVTKEALHALWEAQAGAYDCIFPTMTVGRNPKFEADEPMSAQNIVRLLSLSSARAGIGHLSAHDLRRIHITQALDNGAPLQDMQAQAGHANPSTTLRYAQASDAKSGRERIAY